MQQIEILLLCIYVPSDDKSHAVTKKLLWIQNKICDQQFDRCVQNLTSIRFL